MKFYYKVRTSEGELRIGDLDAVNDIEAITRLQNMGFIVIDISSESNSIKTEKKDEPVNYTPKISRRKGKKYKKVKEDDMILFCDQMSVLLDASVDIIKSLEILSMQISSQTLYDAVVDLKSQVMGGSSLSKAMGKYPKIFTNFMLNLVEIGESGGTLPDVMKRISIHLEKKRDIKTKLKRALTYPAILSGASLFAIILFMVKVIPTFEKIFADFDIELPGLTTGVISISHFIRQYILIEIIVVAGIVFFLKKLLLIPTFRLRFDAKLLEIPALGDLLFKTSIVNFANSFSVLLGNGVPIINALEMVRGSVNNMFLQNILRRVKDSVKGGGSISKELELSGVFPPLVVQMIGVGEETGRLTQMLDKIGEFYEKRVTAAVDAFASMFEPMILIVMGGVIGVLVIAMFLPIFELTNMKSG